MITFSHTHFGYIKILGKHFLQTWGSHVWKLAKACLLLQNWSCSRENLLLHYKNKMRSLHLYNIFMIWPHGMDLLLEFRDHLNIVHPTIKFTSDISYTEISFLDLTIYTKQSQIHTILYIKTTDRHIYLNYFSEHPVSLKNSIPYSQFLRLKKYILNPIIYWRLKYICICFSFGGNTPMTSY